MHNLWTIAKQFLTSSLLVSLLAITVLPALTSVHAVNWTTEFADPFLQGNMGGDERPFDWGIDPQQGLLQNMEEIFYPPMDGGTGGAIWVVLRTAGIGVLILFFIWAGARFILYPDDPAEVKKSQLNVLYVMMGGVLFFLTTWILGTALDFGSIEGITGSDTSALQQVENNIALLVLGFLKGAAFFLAIIFLAYYGYKMMNAFEKEEKLDAAKKGVLNVVTALVFIKIIDYLYFIAQQETFKADAIEFIVEASKFMGYLFGGILVIAIFYAGYLFVTSSGKQENITKASNMIKTIFVVVLIVLLFMLVVYQIFQDILG